MRRQARYKGDTVIASKRTLVGLTAALVTAVLGTVATVPADAASSGQINATVSPRLTAADQPAPKFTLLDRFARGTAREGDADTSAYDIDHVTELQYRLTWAGVFHVGVTGTFGPITKASVQKFQRRAGLQPSGVATHKTWARLLRQTVRHRGRVPDICKTRGWHACYDRAMHQVTLWHRGQLYNTWLVRGGDYGTETRRGNTHVYYRDIDHVSRLFGTPMPYSQFFDGGEAYHGSPLMVNPFEGHSHGCINMYIKDARQLWKLTADHRLNVSVYGHWD